MAGSGVDSVAMTTEQFNSNVFSDVNELKRLHPDDASATNSIKKKHLRDPRLLTTGLEPIKTFNSFELLSQMDDETSDTNANNNNNKNTNNENNNNTEPSTKLPTKPPPIYLKTPVVFKELCLALTNLAGKDSFSCVSTTRGVTIRPASPDSYRKFVTLFKERDLEFHTFQLRDDRAFRVVIRGLHPSIPPTDISNELQLQGYQIRSVVNVISRNKLSLPLHFVDLEPDANNDSIFQLKSLLHTVIRVEEPRKKRLIVQCTRCQQYGHTRSYCNHQIRCVRCGGKHEPTACNKKPEDQPRCANCCKNHPANYRGCEVHKQLQQIRRNSPTYASGRSNETPKPSLSRPSPKFSPNEFPVLPGSTKVTQNSSEEQQIFKNVSNNNMKTVSKYNDTVHCVNNGLDSNILYSHAVNNSMYNSSVNNSLYNHHHLVNNSSSPVNSSHISPTNHTFHDARSSQQAAPLSALLFQLQSLIQPLFDIVKQLTYATQAFLSNGR